MKIAVTGAAGHIGHLLAKRLIEAGHDVSCLLHERSRSYVLPDEVDIYTGDVRDKEVVDELVRGCAGVVHLTFGGKALADTVNVDGTENVVNAARKADCDTLVFTSSISAHPDVIDSEPSPYARTKREAAHCVQVASDDLSTVILYPSSVIGRGDYQLKRFDPYEFVVSNRVLVPPLVGRGGESNYVNIETVVEAIAAGLRGEYKGKHLVTGATLTEREYYALIAKHSPRDHWMPPVPGAGVWLPFVLNLAARVRLLPDREYREILSPKPGEPLPSHLEESSPVPDPGVEAAVADAVEWYRRAGAL